LGNRWLVDWQWNKQFKKSEEKVIVELEYKKMMKVMKIRHKYVKINYSCNRTGKTNKICIQMKNNHENNSLN
jgi:hypothetical protein